MMKLNKKGFTLVELLAVIVILAVVMLIAVTAVGPLMIKSRKSALVTEGIGVVKAAQAAFQAEQMSGTFASTDKVCFSLSWLCDKGYFEKGCTSSSDEYTGSVLANPSGSTITYTYWISNGTYKIENTHSSDTINVESGVVDGSSASVTCALTVGEAGYKFL